MADTGSRATLTDSVVATIRNRIAARSLVPGARLPSVRAFARTEGVSVSTVVEAYERLVADGVIRSRPGSGFYVSGPLAPLSVADIDPKFDREIEPLWISRRSLEAEGDAAMPGCGWLPPSWMPEAALRRALRALARADSAALVDYGTPLGLLPLRQLLSRRLAESGVAAPPSQILLTESGTQAVDLLCRLLLEPGDTVVIDDPCYFNFHALLRAHRARVVGVPVTPVGPDLDRFAQVLARDRPRLYLTNSAVHNPTGAALSPQTAHRLLKLAEGSDLVLVEDDIFADFVAGPPPRLAALDGLDRVVLVGSFSKTLSAAVRTGFIAARPDWIDKLIDLKIATTFGNGRLAAELVLALLKDGSYRRHLDGLRTRLADAMGATIARLHALGIEPWLKPQAGMFLWCRLPDAVDAARLAQHCLQRGVVLAPGNAFSPSQSAGGYLRFNVAQSADPRIYDALADALRAGAVSSAGLAAITGS